MAITQNTFTGDGSTTDYSFTFEYIKEADVKATLDGTATTAFTLANATTLSFTTAPANGVAIRIFRDTDINSLKATFFPGSAIKAEDLNDNFTQNNFAVQEADFNVDTANATADTAKTNSETAIATANTADTNASAAVATANTADTNASAAVATANTASTDASNAVTTANAASTTANSADANATLALNNSRESDGQGGFISAITKANTAIATADTAATDATSAVNTADAATTTANTAATDAASAVTTANSAASDAASAVSTANTAATDAASAVTTANTAATDASSAVSTANTASTNASNAVTTANTADTNATAALNNSRESDGQGGYTSAIDKANTAITTANTATAAVSNAVLFDLIANVAAIPGSPSNNDYIEIGNSTGIESFTPLSGLPSGFVGASGLTVRLRYDSSATSWAFMNYFANDSETRYVAIGNPNPVYYANQAAFPSATDYHGGIAHSHADGAMYYAHGGNWVEMAKDSDVSANTSSIATNTSNISTNTTDIATNTTNIATNTTNIGTNTSDIATNTADIATNTADIATNTADIATNTADIATNSTDIATNSSSINSLTTTVAGKVSATGGTFTGDLVLNDNVKLKVGTDWDLQIYHDGSNTVIGDFGTGSLFLTGADMFIQNSSSENYITCNSNASVRLYYDNAEKLATTSGGVSITGNTTSSNAVIVNNDANQLVLFPGGTAESVIHRNDGSNYYILLSNAGTSATASWNSLRPFYLDNSNGDVYLANGAVVASHSNGYLSANGVSGSWIATQAEAEAGTNNNQIMTPLRVAQAIAAQGGSVIASIQRGVIQPFSNNSTSATATISSVTTSKTMVNKIGQTANYSSSLYADYNHAFYMTSVTLNSSTQLKFERISGSTNTHYNNFKVSYEVIQFT